MAVFEVDPVDFGILFLLQHNARDVTTKEMGEQVGVASSTVATRIRNLETNGVIRGYVPTIDYEKVGFDHVYLVIGTGPERHETRNSFFEEILDIDGVVSLRELAADEENFSIELVGRTREQLFERLEELNERGLKVTRIEMIKREHHQPFNHFGQHLVRDD
ncbi:Lrp/AsnC family transcriptional regulator [Haloferax namakaokahaiae]|uniref:Lrp/AsnC family transcriptional regulator n=1 Tax=Haloferax namakaokahaiae TaxID=1748331 RepID=A0ABD5ZG66_9EURY